MMAIMMMMLIALVKKLREKGKIQEVSNVNFAKQDITTKNPWIYM